MKQNEYRETYSLARMRLIRSMMMLTKEHRGAAVFSTPVGWSI